MQWSIQVCALQPSFAAQESRTARLRHVGGRFGAAIAAAVSGAVEPVGARATWVHVRVGAAERAVGRVDAEAASASKEHRREQEPAHGASSRRPC